MDSSLYAEVAINTHVYQTFIYRIPEHLTIQPGHLVRVNFRTNDDWAVVMSVSDSLPENMAGIELKNIIEPLHPNPVLTLEQISLSRWIAETTLAPIGLCVWLWLPSQQELDDHKDKLITLIDENAAPNDLTQAEIVEKLKQHTGSQRKKKLGGTEDRNFNKALHALVEAGIVSYQSILVELRVPPQKFDTVSLAIHPSTIADTKPHLGRKADLYMHILRVLAREDEPIAVDPVYAQTRAKLRHLQRLAELGFVELGAKQTWRDLLTKRDFIPVAAPPLTPAQATVWRRIQMGADRPFLLHGITGSGKTEIYLRAIEAALAKGRQALFLIPEIALTPQTVRRVTARFPGKVAVVHSGLAFYRTWWQMREGEIAVVIGTRSALFTPLPNLGLIVIDEEHDDSYKNIARPHYDTRQIAEEMMRRNNGIVILGSATPDLETITRAKNGGMVYLRLPDRIMGHRTRIEEQSEREGVQTRYSAAGESALTIDLPSVALVDMREELKSGNTSMFSRALTDALNITLTQQQQAILFLNRRGTATYVFCRDCGYVEACPRCDMPLTYHQHSTTLRCHHCGYEGQTPERCPACGSRRIKFFGAGTQQVEAEFGKHFPNARIVRWDADTASRPDMHDAILGRFLAHEADVMIGTQMIAKGLDLPLVTLVGVISADTMLGLPDFRAAERTFQILTQVAGRAGRGLLGGRVVLQTYRPDHYAIQAAAQYDDTGFYEKEMTYRREMGYPPFRRLARIKFRHTKEIRARDEAQRAAAVLLQKIGELNLTGTEIIGPAPCFFSRVNDFYRWHLLIRSPDPSLLLQATDAAQTWHVDLDPVDVL